MASPLPKLEEMTDILDLKDVHAWDLRWLWGIVLAIAALALFFAGRALWRRLKRSAPVARVPLSPLQLALHQLDELINSRLVESSQIRRFYFSLSDLFREFIEGELEIPACEATLEELRPKLKASPWLDAPKQKEALWLLELADMAKFAQFTPSREEILESVRLCRAWINQVAEHRKKVLASRELAQAEAQA